MTGGDVGSTATRWWPTESGSRSSSPFTSAPHAEQRAGRGRRRAGGGRAPVGPRRRALSAPAGRAGGARRTAPWSSTTATTPTRSRCAPRSTTSPRRRPRGRRVAVLGDMLELGPEERALHREIGAARGARRASTCWSPSARSPRAMLDSVRRRRRTRSPTRRGGRAGAPSLVAPGRRRARQGLARRRARGRGAGARRRGGGSMGEVLIAGTASLLICVFLSPKFIEFLREREFGQHIREEGPQEHHAKAGTPTMGGIIIFTAIAVPFLLLTDSRSRARWPCFGVALACALLGFADDYTKIVKRRSLGLRGRTKLVVTVLISIGLWLVATGVGRPARHAATCDSIDAQSSTSATSTRCHLPRAGGHDVGGQPDRRPRRAGRRLRGDRAARLHRDHVHDGPDRPRPGRRLPGRRLRRLPVVQLVPGVDLHGGHGLARASAARSRRWR